MKVHDSILANAIALWLLDKGLKVVPLQATKEMRECGHDFGFHGNIDGDHPCEEDAAADLYERMVAKAPDLCMVLPGGVEQSGSSLGS